MEQDLISKKELLELTGISYGQLYRWKRKNLIPEEWFIRRSTFTGQETFFPRDKIFARIDRIKNMKDDLSLDDIADVFSPSPANVALTREELLKHNIISQAALDYYAELKGEPAEFSFDKVLYLFVFDKMLQAGEISLEEGKMLLQILADQYHRFDGRICDLIFLRKLGVSTCCLTGEETRFENGAKIVRRLQLAGCVAELKLKIGQEGA